MANNGTSPPEALGQSEAFLNFMELLSLTSKVDRPVLIIGERGTGKELAAQRLHFLSPRWQAPLVTLNCAALPATLIESELFGYEPGAFTGAAKLRHGRFEAAHPGTLFLDELGNMPLNVQEKLLRVVEYGVFERVGGSKPVKVNVRLIGATNKNLKEEVSSGRFLGDLLDRLAFEVLRVPPLREREQDILLLANHFAAGMQSELGRSGFPQLSEEAEDALIQYAWPGNVRELKNVIERAVYKSSDDVISELVFDPFAPMEPAQAAMPLQGQAPNPARDQSAANLPSQKPPEKKPAPAPAMNTDMDFKDAVAEYERDLIRQALKNCRFNQKQAASQLGLTYHQLRGLLRKHGGIEEFGG